MLYSSPFRINWKINDTSECFIGVSKTYKVIRGFEGMNHPDWIGTLTSGQVQTAFGNGVNQLGFSILRIPVSENTNAWQNTVNTEKAAQQLGALVFTTPWNPPSSMSEYFNEGGLSEKRLRHHKYGDYATNLNNFVKFMNGKGIKLHAVSIQNEPDYAHYWTWWTEDECANFAANYANKISNVKVIPCEAFQYNNNYYKVALNNANANKILVFWEITFMEH